MQPEAILSHYDAGTLWPESRTRLTDVPAAYGQALDLRARRIARGETPVGYKIGFTNRTIWERYQVYAPIWGPVYDSTLTRSDGRGTVSLAHTSQPRLEPEIAFGMRGTPSPQATLEEVFDCVEWLAPSFEVVQSHCDAWKFTAAETVADGALHARLLIGKTTPVREFAASGEALDARLASARLRLYRVDRDEARDAATFIEEGTGANVLDGPLHALRHFVHELGACPGGPALKAGDVVTTGTWTDAWPLEPGQTWRSVFDGPFGALEITLT